MKLTSRLIPILLIFTAVIYTACNKNHNVTASPDSMRTLSGQIALSLYKSLAVNYNGINNKGKVLAHIPSGHSATALSSFAPYCGYTIDTAYVNNLTAGDTAKTYSDHFKFIYTCSTGSVDGYIVSDSVASKENGVLFSNTYKTAQNYVVKALDPTYKIISMNGTIGTSIYNSVLASHVATQYHQLTNQFVLSGIRVDFSSGVANATGPVTFTTLKTDFDSSVSNNVSNITYTGTITFLGNNTANLSIQIGAGQPTHYLVNLLTGTVTAI